MKRVLIVGEGSYIGGAVRDYLNCYSDAYSVTMKKATGWRPQQEDFEGIDVVVNAAGIAHRKETKKNRHLYYEVNRDLAITIAQRSKEAGVRQYILLSSMAVYGMTVGRIGKDTEVKPVNAYGKSKAEAEQAIFKLSEGCFKFACLRPPMVYGKGCKGNYQSLRKFALKSPIFPSYPNHRSMIFIGNLCGFIKNVIDEERSGILMPQNAEYVNTGDLVYRISQMHGKKIRLTGAFNGVIRILPLKILQKVFGSLVYDPVDTIELYSYEESVLLTEEE